MQTINDIIINFKISEDRKKTLGNWSSENIPKMMQMAQQIQNLKKRSIKLLLIKNQKQEYSEIVKLRVNLILKNQIMTLSKKTV